MRAKKRKSVKKIDISILTYNRPEYLCLLFKDLEREISKNKDKFIVTIRIYNDFSKLNYRKPLEVIRRNRWVIFNEKRNNGKVNAWRLVTKQYRKCLNSTADYFIFLPDDVRLCNNFLKRVTETWDSIKDDKKISLTLAKDSGRDRGLGPGPCWTNMAPKKINNVWLTGWSDGLIICNKEYLHKLNFRINAIKKSRFKDKHISSGVGRDVSKRLTSLGYNLYCVDKSLVRFSDPESKMNKEERKRNPLIALDFVDEKSNN